MCCITRETNFSVPKFYSIMISSFNLREHPMSSALVFSLDVQQELEKNRMLSQASLRPAIGKFG